MNLLVLLGLVSVLAAAPKKQSPVDLNLTALDAGRTNLRDLRGKVVVLNFWATWCGPCREETPMLVEAEKKWAGKGVVFIGASVDDKKTRGQIPEFVAKYQVRYPVWTGATSADLARLHAGPGVPATLFIDQEGIVFSRVKGQIRREELDQRLEWITGGRNGSEPKAVLNHLN